MTDQDEILKKYKEKKEVIKKLQKSLSELDKQKEFWFKRKEDLKDEINLLVKQIKDFKSERDNANIKIESLKSQRKGYSSQIKNLIKQIKKLNKKKYKVLKRYNVNIDPLKIQQKINELERMVEIEVNFKKEQKLMKQIKDLKRSYEEAPGLNEIIEKTNKISKEITEIKKKADEIYKKIIGYTKDKDYSKFIALSKKINTLRNLQEDAFQKFISFKNEYLKTNNELKSLLEEIKEIKEKHDKLRLISKYEQEQKVNEILNKKTQIVEQKLKQRKKLTTEDIIAYQGK